jgi:hypothetical protein
MSGCFKIQSRPGEQTQTLICWQVIKGILLPPSITSLYQPSPYLSEFVTLDPEAQVDTHSTRHDKQEGKQEAKTACLQGNHQDAVLWKE